jgi:sugar phosphate isomerase/epimerase
MKTTFLSFITYALTVFFLLNSCNQETKQLDNVFYAFNNCVRTLPNAPEGFKAQAALVKDIGYDYMAGHSEDSYFELRAAMDEVGLEMAEIYIPIRIIDGKISYHERLKDVISDSGQRDLLVALHLHAQDFAGTREEADQIFADGITELADFAAPLNVRIGIYPHVNFYCEEVRHSIDIAQKVNRENVGGIFNLCHFLKVEGEEGWENTILAAIPRLFMVSVNGADSGDTRNMEWDRLIQPLGEGSFDTYELVKLLKDNGYEGLFGLQCYNIDQDCETALRKSMNTWVSYQEKYANSR